MLHLYSNIINYRFLFILLNNLCYKLDINKTDNDPDCEPVDLVYSADGIMR